MPEEPPFDPEKVVDALEEKVSQKGRDRSDNDDHSHEASTSIDPAQHDASRMHSADEPPV